MQVISSVRLAVLGYLHQRSQLVYQRLPNVSVLHNALLYQVLYLLKHGASRSVIVNIKLAHANAAVVQNPLPQRVVLVLAAGAQRHIVAWGSPCFFHRLRQL